MHDPVWSLSPGKVPTFETYNAFGTMLLHNSRADADGRFFATEWLMVILPVAPLRRYWVRQGAVHESSGFLSTSTTTEYEIFGRSALRAVEIVRTYLYFWLVLPAVFLGPILYGVLWSPSRTNDTDFYMLGYMFLSVGLTFLVLTLLFLYRTFWRPVREAHWVALVDRPDSDQQ